MSTKIRFARGAAAPPEWTEEYQAIESAYRQAGGEPNQLWMPEIAVLVVSANRVLAANEIPGVSFEAEEMSDGVRARIAVEPKAQIEQPVHLCFGMLPESGLQVIDADYEIGSGARVEFLAHCTFPNARRLQHRMDARIHVGTRAKMTYRESHFHGEHGGIEVVPTTNVIVNEGGWFSTSFSLLQGRVGTLNINYEVTVGAGGVAELVTKAYGCGKDRVNVKEMLRLNGEGARGQTKTRIAVRERAVSEVYTTAEGNAPFSWGHMDCTEIVRDQAVAQNVPAVIVRDERAHVTHEAAIGTVNRQELETLMARGLDEEEAVDVLVRGMLL